MRNKPSEGRSGIPLVGEEDLEWFKESCRDLKMKPVVITPSKKKAEITYRWGVGNRGLADMTHRVPRPERVVVTKVNDGESISIDVTYEGGGQSATMRLFAMKGRDGWYLGSSAVTS